MLSELQVGLRREYARAVRYRQNLALLLVDLPPSADVARPGAGRRSPLRLRRRPRPATAWR